MTDYMSFSTEQPEPITETPSTPNDQELVPQPDLTIKMFLNVDPRICITNASTESQDTDRTIELPLKRLTKNTIMQIAYMLQAFSDSQQRSPIGVVTFESFVNDCLAIAEDLDLRKARASAKTVVKTFNNLRTTSRQCNPIQIFDINLQRRVALAKALPQRIRGDLARAKTAGNHIPPRYVLLQRIPSENGLDEMTIPISEAGRLASLKFYK